MKTLLLTIAAALAVGMGTGCQSPRAARIRNHADLFASLDPATQQIIREGLFLPGFTPQLTYLSLGKPNEVTKRETEHGTVEIWRYRNFVYANVAAMQLSANNPGTKPYGPILSSSAPGGPSLMSTRPGPVQPTVADTNDAPVATLFIEFLNGRVVAARLDP